VKQEIIGESMKELEHPKFVVIDGPLKGKSYTLRDATLNIGRDPSNQIVLLGDEKISRNHCRVFNHLNHYWLEDLDSTNGTFLTQPGQDEMQLTPFQPALLMDDTQMRIGLSRFEIVGVERGDEDTLQMLTLQLQELMHKICDQLPMMAPEKREAYERAVCVLTDDLMAAQSEQDLLEHVAEKIQALAAMFLPGNSLQATVMFDPAFELPPMPDDLSHLNRVARVDSLKNMFISDIKRYLPPYDGKDCHEH
jgi:predicted component of type VI protein secretion system